MGESAETIIKKLANCSGGQKGKYGFSKALFFFAPAAYFLQPLLIAYQTRESIVLFLYDLYSLTREVTPWFVKPAVLEKPSTGAKLLKFHLNDQQNNLLCNNFPIGFCAQKLVNGEICEDTIRLSEIRNFFCFVLFFLLFQLESYFREAH